MLLSLEPAMRIQFTAIDGPNPIRVPARVVAMPNRRLLAQQLAELAAEAGAPVEAAMDNASDRPAGTQDCESLHWRWSPGRSDLPAEPQPEPTTQHVWFTHATSAPGVLRAASENLDVLVVGFRTPPSEENWAPILSVAAVAKRRGVCLVRDKLDLRAQTDLANGLGSNITMLSFAETLAALEQDEHAFDLLAAEEQTAQVLAQAALERSGTKPISSVTSLTVAVGRLCSASTRPHTSCAAAAIRAGVDLLLAINETHAAEKLQNALLLALEDNLHPHTLQHLGPYTRRLSDSEFLQEVRARLGRRPSRLRGVDYAGPQQKVRAAARAHLRLVHAR